MSITTARGVGDAYFATTALGDGSGPAQWIFPVGIFNFEETVESEAVEAQAQVGGVLQTAEAGLSTVTRTLTLTTQIINTNTRPLIHGSLPKTFTNFNLEIRKDAVVPSGLAIADPAITTDNLPFIKVAKAGVGRLTPTANASTAPTTNAQVQIDTTGNDLVFFTGEAGAQITYTIPVEVSTAKGYGGPGAKTALGRLSFRCAVFGLDGTLVEYRHYPALDAVGVPTQTLSGGIPELSLEFQAATPAGWTDPYQVIEADTVVLAP